MFLLYFKSLRGDAFEWLAPHLVPTILVGSMIIHAFYPWRKRKGLWLSVIQVLGAPFTEVRFRQCVSMFVVVAREAHRAKVLFDCVPPLLLSLLCVCAARSLRIS